ncbi:class I SAM-dependent methyltransferase [Ruegeria sp. 2012CJ41-6]|uniref:Class I SAM-dependent methyltransferase n=1 Tax=Ruegeria spongiae TaxID=2942209 RepID=A0ABT0Q8E9_9RHOB|nr:DUF938 domain-containing protein [Ruegeria spongiae]MCL6286130.1 class I SAM-dependent methyltransferase [Ruegeria spongiae]
MTGRPQPPRVSVAEAGEGGRLVAPAATRNAAAICDLLLRIAPDRGRALELASGTGQHIAAFATRLPGLEWQPSEVDAARLTSIDAYCDPLTNVAPALHLDATCPGWGRHHAGQDLIVVINLLHLVSMDAATCLIGEAAQALSPSGRLLIYGPFMRDGVLTSAGDQSFHASLTGSDPGIGYKNDRDVHELLIAADLVPIDPVEMPANNLALLASRST